MPLIRPLVALLFPLLILGTTVSRAAPPAPPGAPWESPHLQDEALVGKAWSTADKRFLTPAEVIDRLAGADFVMLGEKHDNPDHHQLQAWITQTLLDRGRRLAVGYEMMRADQAEAIHAYSAAHKDAAGLGEALTWDKSGWPEWTHYAPMADAALKAGLPIIAANPARDDLMTVARKGVEGFDAGRSARFGLTDTLPPSFQAALNQDIRDSHCNMLPETMVPGMAMAQRLKDGHMARALLDTVTADTLDGAILITGGMHARSDRGVPYMLSRFAPERKTMTVEFLEVQESETDPAAYAAGFGTETLPADIAWFTPRVDTEDPCVKHAESLKKMAKGHGKKE